VYVLLTVIRCNNNLYTYSETIEKFRIRKKEREREREREKESHLRGNRIGMHKKEIRTLSAAERTWG
jgi:hypothetical protein